MSRSSLGNVTVPSRGLLFRVMAYRLQAGTFGDLDRKTVRLLERTADGAEEKLAANGSATPGSDEHAESKPLSARAAYGPLVSLSRPGMDAMPRSPFAQSPAGRLCSTCVRPCLASCSVSYLGLIRQSQRGFDRPGKPEICFAVLPSTQSETPVPPPKSDFEIRRRSHSRGPSYRLGPGPIPGLLWRAKSKRHHPVTTRYCLWLF